MVIRYAVPNFIAGAGVSVTVEPETTRWTGTSAPLVCSWSEVEVTLVGSTACENVRSIDVVGSTPVAPLAGLLDTSVR
jgi:hypothetical protein